jgi:hypothetical protein
MVLFLFSLLVLSSCKWKIGGRNPCLSWIACSVLTYRQQSGFFSSQALLPRDDGQAVAKGSLRNIDSPVDAGDVAVAVVRKVSGVDVFKHAYGRDPSSSNVHLNQRSVVHVRRRPRKPREGCLLLVHAVHLHIQVPLRCEQGLAFVGLEVVTALADQIQMLGFFSLGLAPLLVAPRLVDLPLDVVAPKSRCARVLVSPRPTQRRRVNLLKTESSSFYLCQSRRDRRKRNVHTLHIC